MIMFPIPNPPDYLAPLAEWEAYRAQLVERFSNDPGFSGAMADADGVIRSINGELDKAPLAA
jgi:hypothetical protein